MINLYAYIALLKHFQFKRISCLKSMKKRYKINFLPLNTFLFYQNLYNVTHLPMSDFQFSTQMYTHGTGSHVTDRVRKLAVSACILWYNTEHNTELVKSWQYKCLLTRTKPANFLICHKHYHLSQLARW
jgi:hypothetical protein